MTNRPICKSFCLAPNLSSFELQELHYRASGDIPRQGRAESQLKPWGEIVQDSLQEGKPVANMNRGEKHQPQRRESRSSVADMTTHDRKENERAERRERHGRKESEREGREKHHRRDRSRSRDRRGRSQHASPDLERVSRDEPDRERRHREKESAHRERRRSTSRQKNESREERGRKVHSEKEEGGKGDRRHRGDRGVSKGREGRSRDAGLEERGQGNPTSPLEIFDFQEEAFRERGASSKPSRGSLKSSGGRALQAAVERGEGRSLEMSERRKSETTGERGSDRTGGKVRGVKEMGSERKVGRDEGKSSETLKRRESVTTEERGSDRAGGRLGGEKEMGSEKREERSGGRSSEKLRRKSEGTGEKGSERAGGWRQEVGEEKERGSEKGGVREGRSRDSEKVDRPSSSRRAVVEPKAHETLRSLLELKNDGKKTAEVGGRERELGDAGRDRSERSLPQADGQLFASSEALGREARLAEIGRKDKASIAAGLNGKLSIGAGLWDTEEEEGKLESPLRQRFDPRRAGDSVRQKRSSEGAQASREGSEVGREALSGVGMEPLRAREDSPASVEAHVDYCSPWESKPRPEVRAPKAPDMATRGGEKSPPKTSGVAVTSGEGRPASGRSSVVENGKRTAPALGVGPHETRSTEQIGVAEKPEAAAAEVLRANGKTGGSTINARENVARGSSGKGAGPVGVEVLLAGANGMQDLDRTAAQGVAPGNGKRVDFGMSARAGKLVEKAVEVQSPAASVQRARMLGRTGAVKVLVGPSRAEEDLHTVFEEASGLQTSTALTRLGHVYSESEDENEGEINVESRDEKESEDKNGGKDENEGKQEKESRDEKESKDKLESEIEKESEDKNESRNEKGSDDEEDDRPLFDRMPAEAAAAAAWHGAGRALPLEGGERVWSAIGIEVLASPPLAAAGEVSQAAVEGGSVEGGDSQEEGMLVDVQRVAEAGEEPGGAGDQEEPVGDEVRSVKLPHTALR